MDGIPVTCSFEQVTRISFIGEQVTGIPSIGEQEQDNFEIFSSNFFLYYLACQFKHIFVDVQENRSFQHLQYMFLLRNKKKKLMTHYNQGWVPDVLNVGRKLC